MRSAILVAFLTPAVSGMPILVAFFSAFSMRGSSRASAAAFSSSSVSFSSSSVASSSLPFLYSGASAATPTFLARLSADCRFSSARSVIASSSAAVALAISSSSSLSVCASFTISSSRPSSEHLTSASVSAARLRSFIARFSALRAAFSASISALSDVACLNASVSVTYALYCTPFSSAAVSRSSERSAIASLSFLTAAFSFSIRSRSARASVTTAASNTISSAALTADLSSFRSRALTASLHSCVTRRSSSRRSFSLRAALTSAMWSPDHGSSGASASAASSASSVRVLIAARIALSTTW